MIALRVAKLILIFRRKAKFLLNKGKKEKKTFFARSLDQFRSLEERKKARNVFVMSLRLSDYKVLHNITSSSSYLDFVWIFALFLFAFRTSKFLEFKEFNKTIIPFALVEYETGYSQLGASLAITMSYPTSAHGIIVN